MAIPTLLKSWQFDTNRVMLGATNGNLSHRKLAVLIKNILTQTVHRSHMYAEGSIASVSGSTYRINPTGTSDLTRYNPNEVGDLVGKTIRLRGCTTSNNNGDFIITAQTQISGTTYGIDYTNTNGVAESIAGSVKVVDKSKISNPWKISHTGLSSGSVTGAIDDGIDKIRSETDFVMANGDHAYWVCTNPITGTDWAIDGYSNNAADEGEKARVFGSLSSNRIQARGSASSVPSGLSITQPDGSSDTTDRAWKASSALWFNGVDEAAGAFDAVIHLAVSDDGKHTRLLLCYDGYVTGVWFDEEVQDPIGGWAAPQQVSFYVATGAVTGNAITNAMNDSNITTASDIERTGVGTYYHLPLFASGEGAFSALAGFMTGVDNELNNATSFFGVGLVSNTAGFRGRYGTLKDVWWTNGSVVQGDYFPDDASKQFLAIGAWVIPWNGSIAELSA